jgi:hypothetical protein
MQLNSLYMPAVLGLSARFHCLVEESASGHNESILFPAAY